MNQENLEYSFYLYLQKRLLENADKKKVIRHKEAKIKMSHLRIPERLFPVLLKELQRLELIEKINRHKMKIINCKKCECVDPKNIHRLYHKAGIF